MQSLQCLLKVLLKPDYDAHQCLTPNGQGGSKYNFAQPVGWDEDNYESAEELLEGTIIALPDDSFLEGVDMCDEKTALAEIQKAWIGGYVTGRAWAANKIGVLLDMHLRNPGDSLLRLLSDYVWDEDDQQQELLVLFYLVATRLYRDEEAVARH